MMELLRDLWLRLHQTLNGLLHWVEEFAATPYGGWALFVLAFAESSVFPIPPDILLIALCLGDPESSFWFAAICSLGSVLGGMAGYALGYFGGRPLLYKMFPTESIEWVESYYDRYNAWATGIAGLTPLPYKLVTISGGVFAIQFKIFVLASAISRSARFFAVAAVVYVFGDAAKVFIEKNLNWLSIAFVILLVLGFWVISRGSRRARKSTGEGPEEIEA
jgi:membrane protein YqaA with SNARE-associated domain